MSEFMQQIWKAKQSYLDSAIQYISELYAKQLMARGGKL